MCDSKVIRLVVETGVALEVVVEIMCFFSSKNQVERIRFIICFESESLVGAKRQDSPGISACNNFVV